MEQERASKATRNQRGRDESDRFCGDFIAFAGKKCQIFSNYG
jgi:hypothetical protein